MRIDLVAAVDRDVQLRALRQSGQWNPQLVGPPFGLQGSRNPPDVAQPLCPQFVGQDLEEALGGGACAQAHHHPALDELACRLRGALLGVHGPEAYVWGRKTQNARRVTHHAPSAWLYDGPPNRAEHIVKPPLGTAPLGLALVAQQRGRKADEP